MSAVTIYGVCAVTFMMAMYALESRGRRYVAGFALGCALSSVYGFLAGAWPFGVVEAVWMLVAARRYRSVGAGGGGGGAGGAGARAGGGGGGVGPN